MTTEKHRYLDAYASLCFVWIKIAFRLMKMPRSISISLLHSLFNTSVSQGYSLRRNSKRSIVRRARKKTSLVTYSHVACASFRSLRRIALVGSGLLVLLTQSTGGGAGFQSLKAIISVRLPCLKRSHMRCRQVLSCSSDVGCAAKNRSSRFQQLEKMQSYKKIWGSEL